MKKLVIHVGAHKTGSTFIQRTMSDNINLLSDHGVAYFGGSDARLNFTRNIIYPAVGLNGSENVGRNYEDECREIVNNKAADKDTVFLSNENILGFCDLIMSKGFIYPKSREVSSFLECLKIEWDVKFVFLIRNYSEFMESTYIQKIKEGYSYKFEDYKKICDIEKMTWIDSVENLRGFFGRENVLVIKYEDFKISQENILGDIFQNLCQKKIKLNVEAKKDVNPSYSGVALELAKQANLIIAKKDVLDYRKYLIKRFPSDKYGRPSLLSVEEREMYDDKYNDDCSIIFS